MDYGQKRRNLIRRKSLMESAPDRTRTCNLLIRSHHVNPHFNPISQIRPKHRALRPVATGTGRSKCDIGDLLWTMDGLRFQPHQFMSHTNFSHKLKPFDNRPMNEIFEDDADKSELLRTDALEERREPLQLSEFAVAVVVGSGLFGLGIILGKIWALVF
jgi:hypothetical protein